MEAGSNSAFERLKQSNFFTTEEPDVPAGMERFVQRDKAVAREPRARAKHKASTEVTLKPKTGLMRNYDVLRHISKDQLEFEHVEVEGDVQIEKMQPKPFERFGLPIEQSLEKQNKISKILSNIPNDLDEEEIEIEVIPDQTATDSVIKNTLDFKNNLHLLVAAEPQKRNPIAMPTLIRSRTEFIKVLTEDIKKPRVLSQIDPQSIKTMLTVKSYEQMAEEKRFKEQQKEALDGDYDPEEDGAEDEVPDEEQEEFKIDQLQTQDENMMMSLNDLNMIEGVAAAQPEAVQPETVIPTTEEVVDQVKTEVIEPVATTEQDSAKAANNQTREILSEDKEDLASKVSKPKNRKFKTLKQWSEIREHKLEYEREKRKRQMAQFKKTLGKDYFDDEAEVGSDHEQNDHVVKPINPNAPDELEDGLDKSDEELVEQQSVHINEEDEINAHKEFLKDIMKDEREQIELILNNKYFKRGNNATAEELKEASDRRDRLKKLEEMYDFLQNNTEEQGIEQAPSMELFGFSANQQRQTTYAMENYNKDMEGLLMQIKTQENIKIFEPKKIKISSLIVEVGTSGCINTLTSNPNNFKFSAERKPDVFFAPKQEKDHADAHDKNMEQTLVEMKKAKKTKLNPK